MLVVAELMIRAASERTESRGVHLRTDFPLPDDEHWRRRILLWREEGRIASQQAPQLEQA